MHNKILLCVFASILTAGANAGASKENPDKLLSVIAIHRHGDRTPIFSYPNDPYKNTSFWPVGPGQITNEGKQRLFQLGKWLRKRYSNFLSEEYLQNDIQVLSTDSDRTLMSAASTLAGLYPPKGSQIWHETLRWQPIPIHTASEAILNKLIPGCPKYRKLWANLVKTDFFKMVNDDHKTLLDYLIYYTGENITNIFYVLALRDTLYVQTLFNYTLPEWTQDIYPDQLDALVGLGYASFGYNDDLLRLGTGPFFNNIIQHFQYFSSNHSNNQSSNKAKFLLYSGHDTNIATILSALGAYDHKAPPYGSIIIFELRQNSHENYINIFFKGSDDHAEQINLYGCNYDCELDTFKTILKRITITQDEWQRECYYELLKSVKKFT